MTVWEEQFREVHDLPATPVRVQYVLATTPRCGSHMLGHLLHRWGAFGYPLEYLHARNLERWRARAGGADVLDHVRSIRTSANGCFGLKAHHQHLPALVALEDPARLLASRFVLLRRRDVVAQAVSYVRASQTGSWISGVAPQRPATYSWEAIRARLEQVTAGEAGWRAFTAALGVRTLDVAFEDVLADPDGEVARIAAFLEVEVPPAPAPEGFRPQPQGAGDDWRERFLADSRTRALAGTVPVGVPRPSALRRAAARVSGRRRGAAP